MPQLTIDQAFELAIKHHSAGRIDDAIIAYRQTIKLNPNHAEAHNNLGAALWAKNQLDEAIAEYHKAIALNPNYADAHYNLGKALHKKGLLDQAIAAYGRAVALRPTYVKAHASLAIALTEAKNFPSAIAAYSQALTLAPDASDIHDNLGIALWNDGQHDQAIAAHQKAISLNPNHAGSHCNLGNALRSKGLLDEAIAAYRQALAIDPNLAEAHNNLAGVFRNMGNLTEAVTAYRQAGAINTNVAEYHFNLALMLLQIGDFVPGWEEYEWRLRLPESIYLRRNFDQQKWDGSPLNGRTLLIHAEQGFGDTIQFIRYLPRIIQLGGSIIVECQQPLHRLLKTITGTIPVTATGTLPPRFDIQCPMLSLPRILGTNLTNIPQTVPYLHADSQLVEKWRRRIADDPAPIKIGLAWAGNPIHRNDANRSISLAKFAPLADISGISFYSLQKGAPLKEAPPPNLRLIDLMDEVTDFADTAALIANLNLIISVDTAVIHVAGAMGLPVWTLLSVACDWRWLKSRLDTPWYPTMRLFRQPTRGDWDTVIGDVAEALAAEFALPTPPSQNKSTR